MRTRSNNGDNKIVVLLVNKNVLIHKNVVIYSLADNYLHLRHTFSIFQICGWFEALSLCQSLNH